MRIFLLLLFTLIGCCFTTEEIQGQEKVLKCRNEIGRYCYVEGQKVDTEGFILPPNPVVKVLKIGDNNEVKFLPENVGKSFPKLFFYHVYGCAVKSVNQYHLKGLHELVKLAFRGNEIETITIDAFKDLGKLEYLNLAGNKIKVVDSKWFQPLKIVDEVLLHSNGIANLDENVFENLPNLKYVYLENNTLSSIPEKLFEHNLKMEKIWLQKNQIQTINSSMFDHLGKLSVVDLRVNICVDRLYMTNTTNSINAFDISGEGLLKKDLEKANCTQN